MGWKPRVADQDVDLLIGEFWRTLVLLLASRTLLLPKPRSMLCISMDMYELGSATRITKSRRLMLKRAIRLIPPAVNQSRRSLIQSAVAVRGDLEQIQSHHAFFVRKRSLN